MHRLQKLLLKSASLKMLAIRKVTQDNKGHNTAGVDGVARLTQKQHLLLVKSINLKEKAKPLRRIWIPKEESEEKRPIGIPTISERAKQAMIKMVLEPEWEAKFEPNSYGFRPGRSCHDAKAAIYFSLASKMAYVLDADIKGCFDNIDHAKLLKKLKTTTVLKKIIKGWLESGIMDISSQRKVESGIIGQPEWEDIL